MATTPPLSRKWSQDSGVVELEVLESGKQGLKTWEEGPRRGKLGRQDATLLCRRLMWHDLTSKQFGTLTIRLCHPPPIRRVSVGFCSFSVQFGFQAAWLLSSWCHAGILIRTKCSFRRWPIFLHHQKALSWKRPKWCWLRGLLPGTAALCLQLRQWVNEVQSEGVPKQVYRQRCREKLLISITHTLKCAG